MALISSHLEGDVCKMLGWESGRGKRRRDDKERGRENMIKIRDTYHISVIVPMIAYRVVGRAPAEFTRQLTILNRIVQTVCILLYIFIYVYDRPRAHKITPEHSITCVVT